MRPMALYASIRVSLIQFPGERIRNSVGWHLTNIIPRR
jgi:hypothetical protein